MVSKEKEMSCGTHCGCHRGKGLMMLVLGILILINSYLGWLDWWMFVGSMLALIGLIHVAIPHCKCK